MELLKAQAAALRHVLLLHQRELLDSISSEAFLDQMVEWGAKFVWYFHYMPVGNDAAPELLPTPEQREQMYHQIRAYPRHQAHLRAWTSRTTASTWAAASPAGGATCTSTPTATWIPACSSTTPTPTSATCTLLEALQSPLFMAYHDGQPFNEQPRCAPAPCWKTRSGCASW